MPFAITGGRYAASSVSSVGTTTVTVGTTPFVQADFTKQRLVGLWSNINQITNSGFDADTDWTKGTGVTISGGVANVTNGAAILSQSSPSFIAGRTYQVSIAYNKTAGLQLRFGTGTTDGSNVVFTSAVLANGTGTITFAFTPSANTTGFYVGASGIIYSGTLDNFTITDNTLKGMAYVRRWVSTSQLQLEKPFFDPATGLTVTQVVGDQILVSKDFTESVVAGLAVSGRVVSITDTCTFGVDNNPMGVCLYDENKLINATFGTLLSGGLTVFGKLNDYATDQVSASIDFQSTNANPILCNNASANFCGYGGRWESSAAPAYFIGGSNQGTAGYTVILNSVETPNDLLTNTAGGVWARNADRHQLVNCYSITTSTNAIMRRWGNGIIRGGRYKVPNNSSGPISAFGSDSAGTNNVLANPNTRAVILDIGNGPALVRASTAVALNFNFTNLITTDFRSVTGASGSLTANPNGTNTFRFSDTYTNLQSGTVGVILNNSGAVADSIASSGTSWSPSLLRRTCVGSTVTVNATSWTYGFKDYGYQVVSGSITPSTYDLGTAGSADNVSFGGLVNQLVDSYITLSQSSANALTSISTLDELYDASINWNTLNVTNAQYPSLSAYIVSGNGTELNLGNRNLVIDGTASQAFAVNTGTNTITIKASALNAGTKLKSLTTTGNVTFANGGSITTPYTDASGTRVTIKTTDNLPLSTYLTIDGVPQAWTTGQTAINIFVTPSSVVRIYAHSYGYQPKIINITGNNPNDYITSLLPETNVDTSLNTTTRNTIASSFATGIDGSSRLFLSVNTDLRQYQPAEVLNALHYFAVNSGSLFAQAAVATNTVSGFGLMRGGFIVASPSFYGKVADSVTTVNNLGILVPLSIYVDPSVYTAMPTYTPVEKNTSGIVLQYAPWTQQEADIPSWVAQESHLQTVNRNVIKASKIIPASETF